MPGYPGVPRRINGTHTGDRMPPPSSTLSPQMPGRLREQDRYIRNVLWQYPQVPRVIDDPWYPTRNRLYQFLALCAVSFSIILCGFAADILMFIQTGKFWQSPTVVGATLFGPFTILTLWYVVMYPLYAWRAGLRSGCPAVAVVTFISERPAPNSVRGTWEVRRDDRRFTATFGEFTLEEGTWVQCLREGDRIHVLIHPTWNKVLLAYGP